jgi:hypothetical protein
VKASPRDLLNILKDDRNRIGSRALRHTMLRVCEIISEERSLRARWTRTTHEDDLP